MIRKGDVIHNSITGETIRFAVSYECRTEVSELSVLVAIKCEQGDYNITTARHRLSATSLPAGAGHWNSPIVVAGMVALPEGDANEHRQSGVLDIYRLP